MFCSAFLRASNREGWQFLEPPRQSDELGRLAGDLILRIFGAGGMSISRRLESQAAIRHIHRGHGP